MKKYLPVLEKCPLFSGIESEKIIGLLGCLGAVARRLGEGESLFPEGERATRLGIVLSGEVQIIQQDYFGNRSIISALGEGFLVGEEFACAGTELVPVEMVASRESEVMLIESVRILRTCHAACGHHHQLIYNMMRAIAEKTVSLHERMSATSRRTTREKLLAYLSAFSRRVGKRAFDIPFDRQELADYLEVDRSGLSAELGKLAREGILRTRKSHFVLRGGVG